MSKKALRLLAGVVLLLSMTALSVAQETKTTVVQNPDGTFTVVEYPVGKEVQVVLTPVGIPAEGVATILRDDAGTRIKLNLNKLPAELKTVNLYAVDHTGAITSLGPVTVSNGTATFTGTTPLSRFMLIASPEASLTTYDPNTKVIFRSAVPQGFAVIPRSVNVEGERVSAVTTPATTESPYTVPMLGVSNFKRGEDTEMKIKFSGALTGARANAYIKPRDDGPTEVRVRFHELKEAPSGQIFVVWAVSPDNKFVKLGQVVNAPGRNEAEIKSETTLTDFGLLITMEDATGTMANPLGPNIGVIEVIK
jgi:hypothetical protein